MLELKSIILGVTIGNAPTRDVGQCVSLCRNIAVVFLRRKASTGKVDPDFFGVSLDDVALDSIADLFQRDEKGDLIQLKAYFEGISIETSSDEELLTHLRRLVFAKVNQGLFRMYNETDPALGKILRNIKLAVQSLDNFAIVERFGESCLVPAMCETLEHLPQADRADLEAVLKEAMHRLDTIPSLLSHLSLCLRNQCTHSRIVPLMDVAFSIRDIYSRRKIDPGMTQPVDRFTEEDAKKIIDECCRKMICETRKQYVGQGKVSEERFEKYFHVIRENLEARIIEHDGELFSFFDRLKTLVPEMTKDEYGKYDKSKIEYLARLTHNRTISELKKNFG